jgi:hypothetical protein
MHWQKVLEKREISRMQKIGVDQRRDVEHGQELKLRIMRCGKILKDDDTLVSTAYGEIDSSDSAYGYQPPEMFTQGDVTSMPPRRNKRS